MLVLTRRVDEPIVMVTGIYGDAVRIGVTAPRSVPVRRAEVPRAPDERPAAGEARS